MIAGIMAVVMCACCGLLAIPLAIAAIVMSVLARGQIDATGGAQGGSGQATAGLWLGIAALVLSVGLTVLAAVVRGVAFGFGFG